VTALTVPDVLRRAEQEVAKRGHHKGWYVDDNRRSVCILGACAVAVGMVPKSEAEDFWADWMRTDNDAYGVFSGAWSAVSQYLDDNPPQWNDAPDRTAAEVRAALLVAAQRAEAGT
jgi:hypothetical protein